MTAAVRLLDGPERDAVMPHVDRWVNECGVRLLDGPLPGPHTIEGDPLDLLGATPVGLDI